MTADRAVILAAHGGGNDSQANRTILHLVDALRTRHPAWAVRAAFHLGEPAFAAALDDIDAGAIVVVPIMTSRGYYCDDVLPRELARHRDYDPQHIRITPPVGAHPRLGSTLEQRVRTLMASHDLPHDDTAVVVVGHGTPRHARSRQTAVDLAAALSSTVPAVAVFIDDEPRLSDVAEHVSCGHIIALPFLIGGGAHANEDIARQLADPRLANRRIVTDVPLGQLPEMVDVISALIVGPPDILRIGTRGSALARWQTDQVAQRLRDAGCAVEIVELDTVGDRDRARPIAELDGAAPFADDIEQALIAGDIDAAVHSLKDLAPQGRSELELAAILERGAVSEALVSTTAQPLSALAPGARVGTSSERRAAQILALRPDLHVAPLRGTIEQRVEQVRSGQLDAAVMATAGLQRLGLAEAAAETFDLGVMLPAPGQGAIAVQIRADDAATRARVAALDHPPTRSATAAELALLRALATRRDTTMAAWATCGADIELHARILTLDGRHQRDITAHGPTIDDVVAAALDQLSTVDGITQ